MFGASSTIARFDESSRRGGTIFAGGGRGVELVPSEESAASRAAELVDTFRKETCGGVMATAFVPYDPAAPAQSLRWLRRKLDLQKDQAKPPGGIIPSAKNDQCAECGIYHARHRSTRPDWQGEMVCDRCDAMTSAGRHQSREIAERIKSLVDLSPKTARVAAVSVDGNDLGDFFERLDSAEALALASEAIQQIFHKAHQEARRGLMSEQVSLATGGDDIRLFLAWEDLLDYVGALVPAIEREADALARLGAPLDRLAGLGIGIGAVVADARLPASRLMAFAHELERSAKRRCRPSTQQNKTGSRVRSAFDFAVLTAGDAAFRAQDGRPKDPARPINMASHAWKKLRRDATLLAKMPRAQLAILAEVHSLDEEEGANLFRYQVARSDDWQKWYHDCDLDWRDPQRVWHERPRPLHLDLVRLIPSKAS